MSQAARIHRILERAANDALVAEWTATYRLDEHVARARREMGEARWRELNAEWETGRE